ncbi:MAG TPA: type II toxin-antitoxin system VapC family toxin [Pyrinomonadaceae bacterium]|nr:type II toxin-antitoxin system VapC family toxin [Pyrinomonadaceae bacterium]
MKKPKTIVLDSWAIMAFLEDEPAAERVADLIADAAEQGTTVLMSVINVGEVWYSTARRRSERNADQALRWLNEMGIVIVDVDMKLTQLAASYKAKGGISYADCFAAALAKQNKATLVTGDQEFKQLEKDITINWL